MSTSKALTIHYKSFNISAMKGKKPERTKKVLGFEADPVMRSQIDEIAKKEDRPRSWVIRQLLLRALASNEKTA